MVCPLAGLCAARAAGTAEQLPRRTPKAPRPTRHGVAFWLVDQEGSVLLRRRAEKGLLGGMMEVPSTIWREKVWCAGEARRHAPETADWRALPGLVRHTFTHFHLELAVWAGHVPAPDGPVDQIEGKWVPVDDLSSEALPSVMRKVIHHALTHAAEA